MSEKDLRQALCGPKGSIDAYLEVVDENEFRADVLAFADHKPDAERREFAKAMMVGLMSRSWEGRGSDAEIIAQWARSAVYCADALLAELAKPVSP